MPNTSQKRLVRIELTFSAWQADGLPLHHRRDYFGSTKLSKISLCSRNCQFNEQSTATNEYVGARNRTRAAALRKRCHSTRPSVLVFFSFRSGTGGNRTHIVRFKRPMHYLVCHNPKLGCRRYAVGFEESLCDLLFLKPPASRLRPVKSRRGGN